MITQILFVLKCAHFGSGQIARLFMLSFVHFTCKLESIEKYKND